MNETLLNKARLNVVSLNKALINGAVERHGSSAGGGGTPSKYIRFADPAVEAVLMANGVSSDGVGITKEDAAAVTSIGTWFRGNTAIQSFDELKYFTGVTDIKDGAFNSCTSLASINLDNVTIIRASAFYGCSALNQYMRIPQVTILGNQSFRNSGIVGADISGVQVLTGGYNGGAFGGCSSLREVIFSPYLTDIQQFSFINCTALESANIPASVTAIGTQAFYNCTSLAFDYLNLPNLTTLGGNVFYNVKIKKLNLGKVTSLPGATASSQNYGDKSVLEEVVIPEGVTSIPSLSFYNYTALTKAELPDSITSINGSAFFSAKLTSVNLKNVQTISTASFKGNALTEISLPSIISLVGEAGNGPFVRCPALKKIDVGASCTSIGTSAFEWCTSLESIIVRATTPPSFAVSALNNNNNTFVIYVPDAALEVYKTATNWSSYADRIHPLSELEGSPYIQFADAEVERVLMENNVSSDGVGITMADAQAVTDISSWFRGNTAIEFFDELKNFTGLKSIGHSLYFDSGFSGCTNLKSTTLPPSVTYLGYRAFYKTAFAEINLENVTEMHANVFVQSALTEVYAPNLAIVKEGVFKGCASLRKASFGKVAEWVSTNSNQGSFDGCSSLQEMDLSGTKLVGQYTFNNCKALTSVIGWQDLEEIQYNAFVNCTALAVDVILPKLKKADEGIFRLSGIKRVLDLGSIPEVKGTNDYDGAFSGCSNLEVIIFPASVTTFGASVTRASNNIKAHIIKSTDVPTLGSTNAFGSSTPIYVLDSLVDSYKTATNWTNYSNRIRPISQLATDNPTLYAEIQQYL